MILSHTHKFVFIANGRTGTSSIESALASYHEGEHVQHHVRGLYAAKHVPPGVVRAQLGPGIWDELFTFCFVRNPWDWVVPQYFWNFETSPITWTDMLKNPVHTLRRKKAKNAAISSEKLKVFSPSDIRQLYNHLRRYRGVYEADTLFQRSYAYAPDGTKLVDYVGRFESMEEDFQRVIEHLGLNDIEVPHKNSTSHEDYRSYYTDETAELVRSLWKVDVNTFGYTFD
jgi:hypothetical protein